MHRRWPDHAELIAEALLESAGTAIPIPDTGTVCGDLERLLRDIAALIDTPERRRRIRALLADASRSPQIGTLVGRVCNTRFEHGREDIKRGGARGELRTDIPAATLLAAFVGPPYVRLLIIDERIDDGFIDDVIDAGLDGVRAAPGEPGGGGRA